MDVGRQLREAREARGLSIKTLAATTRIHARVLDAIERNDLSAVPPHPYARGFIASYARELHLDREQVVRDYFAQFDTPVETIAPAEIISTPPHLTPPHAGIDGRRWMPVIALVALAVAAAVLLRKPEAVRTSEPQTVGTSGNVAPPAVAAKPAANEDRIPAPATTPGEIVVRLDVERPVWVSANADGRRLIYRVLQPGTTETLRARGEIVLRVGDAGAVKWSVNGRTPTLMGREGEVRTVRMTPTTPGNVEDR